MMRTVKNLVVFFTVLALCAGSLQAKDIEINITAQIIGVDDRANLLEGKINVGDIITGSYIYDSDTSGNNGVYDYLSNPYGIYLSAGGFVFQTDPENVDFKIVIGNNIRGADFYNVRSYNNLPLNNNVYVSYISWSLNDYSCTAISSDALPTTPPVLED